MKRPHHLLALPLLLACACGPSDAPSPAAETVAPARSLPLNVVVITLDTTRADALGAYGQTLPATPRIDALAANGLLFEQALTSAPSTLPSHSTLFTGKHPYAHGVRSNFGYVLPEANVTLAEVLRSRGYRTAAEIAAPVLARGRQLEQGFDVYRDPGKVETLVERFEEQQAGRSRLTRNAEEITRFGVEFLRENRARPFLLWLHYFDPHHPYEPPFEFARRIPGSPYHAEVARTDDAVGHIVDEIERLGLRERTLMVVTADHGEGLGQHAEDSHTFFVYDTTMRVPLIFWGADVVPRGRQVSSLVRLVDVAPTLLDLLGAPLPPGMQGVSLRPLLEDPTADLSLTGYGESIEPAANFGSSVLRFVREGRWKYIHKLEPELYDVRKDPDETRNLASQHPEVVDRLRESLHALIASAPRKPGGAEVEMDAETIVRLQALGYVGGQAPSGLSDELAALEVRGPDPSTRSEDVLNVALGYGHLLQQRFAEAEVLFRRVFERNPDSVASLRALIAAVNKQERHDELEPLLRRAIELEPERAVYKSHLAKVLRKRGELDEAEDLFRQALLLDACAVRVRLHLSDLLRESKRYDEQVALLEAGDDACFESVVVRNGLAYALATAPSDAFRDGERALRLAEAAVEETDGEHPGYLDSLACAHAELGQFDRAVEVQKRAIVLVKGRVLPPVILENYEKHLARFEAGEAVRAP
jgi:arylsulfatase A-like enzyme/Tfp pilus assembly protein PilF